MAKRFLVLAVVLTLPAFVGTLSAQEPTPGDAPPAKEPGKPGKPQDRDSGPGHDKFGGHGPDDRDFPGRFKERLDQMSPEERQHFAENWERWKEMGDKEREEWKKRAEEAHRRIEKAIDDTLEKLDLKLDQDQREVFELRYRQERKKIEKQLCDEMNDRRKTMIDEMLQRLKVEFSSKPAVATPTPAPSAN